MTFQFFIQPTNIVVDAKIMERLLDQASSIPGRVIPGYNPETILGEFSRIPVLKMGVSEQGIGEYREAWFVHHGHLFQLNMVNTHPDSLDAWFNHTVHYNIYFPNSIMVEPSAANGLEQTSVLLIHQLGPLDKQFLLKKIGQLESETFAEVKRHIRDFFS